MNQKYEKIFQPYKFPSGVEVKNRIMMAPMTTYSSDDQGVVTDDELAYYAERSAGVGAVVTACAYVSAGGKGFPGQFSADDDSFIPSLRKLAETIQSNGSKAILQIYHGGGKVLRNYCQIANLFLQVPLLPTMKHRYRGKWVKMKYKT